MINATHKCIISGSFVVNLQPAMDGRTGRNAPGISEKPGEYPYQCVHNVIKAHARVYHTYNNTYRGTQRGEGQALEQACPLLSGSTYRSKPQQFGIAFAPEGNKLVLDRP